MIQTVQSSSGVGSARAAFEKTINQNRQNGEVKSGVAPRTMRRSSMSNVSASISGAVPLKCAPLTPKATVSTSKRRGSLFAVSVTGILSPPPFGEPEDPAGAKSSPPDQAITHQSPHQPRQQNISCAPSPGNIKDRLRYFEAEKQKQTSSVESTMCSNGLKAMRRSSLSDAPKPRTYAPTTPQRRGSLLTSPSPRTVISGPPLTESADSSRFEMKKDLRRTSSGDSCSTTSAESTSNNSAEMYGYDDAEPSTQDYGYGDYRSTARRTSTYSARRTSTSLSPIKRSKISDSSPTTSQFKPTLIGLPPPPFSLARTPRNASSKGSTTSPHAVSNAPPSLILSPVKSRINMLNVSKATPAPTSNVSSTPGTPSTPNTPIFESPPSSPSTPKKTLYESPPSSPIKSEKPACVSPLCSPMTPLKSVHEIPLRSAMKSPIKRTLKTAKSFAFSHLLALDLETKEIIKREPSKEERVEAAITVQAVFRGREGRIKARYFMLRKQLDEADGKKEQELRRVQEELEYKKNELFERAKARSMRNDQKIEKVAASKVEENQATVQSLRKGNSKMREKNKKLKSALRELSADYCRLENSIAVSEDYFGKLVIHQEGAVKENERLTAIRPMYTAKVDELEAKSETLRQYGAAEFKMKMCYQNFIFAVAGMVEKCDDEGLEGLINGYIIEFIGGGL